MNDFIESVKDLKKLSDELGELDTLLCGSGMHGKLLNVKESGAASLSGVRVLLDEYLKPNEAIGIDANGNYLFMVWSE